MKNAISEGIQNKNLLSFNYNGYYRVVEPFTLGVSMKGNDVLSAYQVRGESESDNNNPWRLFDLEKIENIQILAENFNGYRDGYNRNDKRMNVIYCRI